MNVRLVNAAFAASLLAAAGCAGGAAAPGAAGAAPAAPAPAPKRDAATEAFAARQARDFARAEAIASAEIDAGHGHARLFFERGVARMELGKKEEALEDFRRLNAIQEDPSALLLAGSIEMQLARWEDAEKDLARAVALAPSNARAWASLAQARNALRDVPGATAAHEKAAALAPEDAYVREVGERLSRVQPKPEAAPEAAPAPAAASAPPPKQ
jgi:tetratricopeptide (TPR) repeat protein